MTKTEDSTPHAPMTRAQFHSTFGQLASVLLEEWPQLEADTLSGTSGELEKVVALIVDKTGHTKTLIRRQLEELYRVVTAPIETKTSTARSAAFAQEAHAAASSVSHAAQEALHTAEDILLQLEKKVGHLFRELQARKLHSGVLAKTASSIREHWFLSLLSALGLGFISGILFGGLTRGK